MVMEEQHSDMELAAEKIPVPQVQKQIEMPSVETNNRIKSISRSKPRFRKKALHAAILKQMEFYFSDANLSKDRFLGNLIKEDSYVDLSIFTRFNKIRELTTDINRIAKALQASTMLSISEDGLKVCRITPIKQKENTEDCTVYVQNLPPGANHDWLSSIFSQYGNVAYVSIPHYKINKKIKGFAFVEFDTPEEAKKCIKAFRKMDCLLPSHTNPDELLSITTFDDVEKDVTMEGKMIKMKQSETNLTNDINSKVKITNPETFDIEMESELDENKQYAIKESIKIEENCNDSKSVIKRKHSSSSITDADTDVKDKMIVSEPETKKSKKNNKHVNEITNNHLCDIEPENEFSNEDNILQESEKMDLNEGSEEMNELSKRPKKKFKKLKSENDISVNEISKNTIKKENIIIENVEMTNNTNTEEAVVDEKKKKRKRKRKSRIDDDSISNIGLQIMAKKHWKYLRNKYLELQRSKMKQLKQHLKKTRNQWYNYDRTKSDKEDTEEKEKISATDKTPRLSFIPGVIVKIELNEPCTDSRSLKAELKGNNNIKYIDVSESANEVYVRCDTSESAQFFIQKSNKEKNMVILKDEDERIYWNKILQDREEKLSKKIRVKQRGRSKLLKKAEKELGKHIKFDEV
ncbi:la-related protein 7 [Vespa crabro]|uniref:la-related protein 7 n=1 Tax=Vespa crabro TaxID=7445 RepID=UPI001F01B6F4|nr:la-related protein 7 [Vespa crabro]XP_046838557.1 la-related protein 7 [Vespa crabro]